MKGIGKGGAWGGRGDPVWSRTRASRPGDPGRGAPAEASGRLAPDGLDALRLGRPKLHLSVRTARILAVAVVLANTPTLLDTDWVSRPSRTLIPPVLFSFGIAVASSLLASCRCERDVRVGRRAAWAYPWDWIQLSFLAVATGMAWVFAEGPFSLAFAGMLTVVLAGTVRAMVLRRRRARAAWSTEVVDATFE